MIFILENMQEYNREKAVLYAKNWWNKRNPLFFDFENSGGDCTNFVNQCLLYGGFEMQPNWFYSSLNKRSSSWTGVNELYAFLITNTTNFGPKGKIVSIEKVEVGDIVQLAINSEIFHHTLIITEISQPFCPQNIFVSCHTADRFNIPLSSYAYKKVRFIKIME